MNKLTPRFEDYERITDILLFLSDKFSLNFIVVLCSKDKNGAKRFFQFETEYASRYIGSDVARAIKRNVRFYFTIDNRESFGEGFVIKPQDAFVITRLIEDQVFPWFFDPKKRIFSIVDKNLVINGKYTPIIYAQNETRFLSFTPIVYSFDEGTFKEGIRMEVNHQAEFVDMDIDKFIGFYYLLKNTDMYSAACSLINYVKIMPYGNNVFRMAGLGGGDPLPEFEMNHRENKIETKSTNEQKRNSFLDAVKERKGKNK